MVRSFRADPIPEAILERLLDQCRRAPSAGNTQSLELLALTGDAVERYWATTLPHPRREQFPWPGLIAAPALVIPYVDPQRYVDRYAEPDKSASGLGAGLEAWPVPYWWVDGGAAVQTLLLSAVAEGLGACLFGQFDHESAIRAAFAVPPTLRAVGTVAIGYEDPVAGRVSASARRPRRPLSAVVHRDRW